MVRRARVSEVDCFPLLGVAGVLLGALPLPADILREVLPPGVTGVMLRVFPLPPGALPEVSMLDKRGLLVNLSVCLLAGVDSGSRVRFCVCADVSTLCQHSSEEGRPCITRFAGDQAYEKIANLLGWLQPPQRAHPLRLSLRWSQKASAITVSKDLKKTRIHRRVPLRYGNPLPQCPGK